MAVSNAELKKDIEALNKAVSEIPVSIARLEAKHDANSEILMKHEKVLYGNGQPGLIKDVNEIKVWGKVPTVLLGLIVAALAVIQSLTGCGLTQHETHDATAIAQLESVPAPAATIAMDKLPEPQRTAIALNSTYVAETQHAPVAVSAQSWETETPIPTPTVRPTSSIVTVTPRPTTTPVDHIIEVNTQEIEWLGALCWVEIKNFGDKRPGACASVVDTVMTRIKRHELSDGDVYSTITWGCNAKTIACQFPRWVIDGCEGITPRACPFYDTENMIYFRGIILGYLTGDIKPTCPGRIYYGNKVTDRGDCEIVAPNGDIEGWHN